jgi:Sulfite reductase, beta subunit (hemoprotein)
VRAVLPRHHAGEFAGARNSAQARGGADRGIQDLGLCSRGSGADNIRNVTGTPTAGIDPQEILDTREYAREWHYHILNDRSLTVCRASSTSPSTAPARSRCWKIPTTSRFPPSR